jgi:hypothetical protein
MATIKAMLTRRINSEACGNLDQLLHVGSRTCGWGHIIRVCSNEIAHPSRGYIVVSN